jgi:PAS domain S-box-containing protein
MENLEKNINIKNIEKYFKQMVENSLDVITVLQLDSKIIYTNYSSERITGYKTEEFIGKSVLDFVNPDDLKKTKEAIFNAIKNPGNMQTVELRIKRKDGSWAYLEARGTVSLDFSETVIIVNSRDISDKKETEEKIRAVMDQTSQLFGLTSVDGTLLMANNTALQYSGVKESDVLNKPFWETVWWAHSGDLQEKLKDGVKRAASGEIIKFEVTHPDANKKLNYFDFCIKPFKNVAGKITFLIVESHDISERKKLEEQILKEQREQENILDSIPALIFYKDKENHFIHVNSTYSDMVGIQKRDLEGKSGSDVFPKEQSEKFFKDDKEVIESGKAKIGIIEEAKFPDGNHWVKTDKIPFKDENGNIVGIIGFAIDITENKIAEEKKNEYLRELEKFKNLMIGRELKMIELKEKIDKLEFRLEENSQQDSSGQNVKQKGQSEGKETT